MGSLTNEIEEYDPDKFIDRKVEQELFEDLLRFKEDARVLAIQDVSGKGKSMLLRQMEYKCQWVLSSAVALISLDQLPDASPFGLVNAIRNRMKEVAFDGYDALNAARVNRKEGFLVQAAAAAYAAPSIHGTVRAENANISGTGFTVAGGVTNINSPTFNMSGYAEWREDQEALARDLCVTRFFEDMRTVCRDRAVAILLDAWDGCGSSLKPWIRSTLLRVHCFDQRARPEKLVVVIAGREPVMNFKRDLGEEKCNRLVKSISSLGDWEVEHVKQFLAINNVAGIDDSDAEYICGKLRRGWPLLKALTYVKEYLKAS